MSTASALPVVARLRIVANLFVLQAVRALWRHKMRSGLAILGIVIGIAAVVLVVAVGQAGTARAEAELQKLGDNLVWVEAGSRNIAGTRTGSHGTTSLTLEDEAAILREVPDLKSCSPQMDGTAQLVHGNTNWTTRWRGETPEYLEIKKWEIAEGAPLTVDDVEQSASRLLVGQTVREQLFGSGNAVGEVVRVDGQVFEVKGVLAAKGQAGDGRDQDDWFLLPYTTAERRLRGKGLVYLDDILCSATAPTAVNPAIDRIIRLMRQRHQIRPGTDDDFNIRRPDEILKAQVDASDTLALLLLAIGAVSLLVGGIGIMNVMLASVAQRTGEIGLRLAVGAKPSAVLVQFLGEATILCLVGGVGGVGVSAAGSSAFERLLGWPIVVSPEALAVAVAVAAGVGVLAGLFPAWRAAQLDPIEALRRE